MSCLCPHRLSLPAPPGGAACGIVGEFVRDLDLAPDPLPAGTCEACLTHGPSEPWTLNPITASVLLNTVARHNKDREGDDPATVRGRELFQLAVRHLEFEPGTVPDHRCRVPSYSRPCYFASALPTGVAATATTAPAGTGRAELACRHPCQPAQVAASACATCTDYDPQLAVGEVATWMVGLTTAPRRTETLARTAASLVAAGWDRYHLFAEPGCTIPDALTPESVTVRNERLGAWPNFLLALHELMLRDPEADVYLMVQDDVLFCRGLRSYLEWRLWPDPALGVLSLYTPRHHRSSGPPGFFARDVGWGAWGALAYAFPNAAARSLLSDPRVIGHRARGPREGLVNVDSVVGKWCRDTGQAYWMHSPSLAQHIGETTTLRGQDTLEGRRSAGDFPGVEADIRLVMREM